MKNLPSFVFLSACAALALQAAPVPHATRSDRLVETRNERSVEYSPGQEAWMEMAFARMETEASFPPPPPAAEGPPPPGSPRDLRARREAILAAAAREIGLPAAAPLQVKAFDTFLGYYEMGAELYLSLGSAIPARIEIRHVAIWQRDHLVERLKSGDKIPGMSYDPATDRARFDFNSSLGLDGRTKDRMKEINDAIKAQQLNHTFNFDKSGYSASVTPHAPPRSTQEKAAATTPTPPGDSFAELVLPVVYRGALDTAPTAEVFDTNWVNLQNVGRSLEQGFRNYRDPMMVSVILHEATEVGLIDRVIASKDRRWLCDGTANYVAWEVSREFFGADFAQRVFDLDAKLREYAALQPKIDLTRWSATENQDPKQQDSDLTRAHYVFATRAMFLLARQHGNDAVAKLWHDVAQTDPKKVTAATFAKAYRKRYRADLANLVKAAERNPIPAAPAPGSRP